MKRDQEIFDLIAAERSRQEHGIELIASNFVSDEVMQQWVLYSQINMRKDLGKRYYGGCEVAR